MLAIKKILVPIDFGASSLEALRAAIELAATFEASIVVMHAYEMPVLGLGMVPEATFVTGSADADRVAALAEAALAGVVREHAHTGVPMQTVLREGPAWREIETVAEATGADLIVLGTHTRRGLLHALLGGVADRVVRSAHTPVLTIHSAEGA